MILLHLKEMKIVASACIMLNNGVSLSSVSQILNKFLVSEDFHKHTELTMKQIDFSFPFFKIINLTLQLLGEVGPFHEIPLKQTNNSRFSDPFFPFLHMTRFKVYIYIYS